MSSIDYSPLGKAVQRLKEGLAALQGDPANTLYRDAVIQRFEFTYGLCASMLKRRLARTEAAAPDSEMSFPTLIRTASEYGLLRSGWDIWSDFRQARNLISQVYIEEVAQRVVERIPGFTHEAEFLYERLGKAED
jgi:nucleotidyltransferase substrate binding protein (TIGR01987 family)